MTKKVKEQPRGGDCPLQDLLDQAGVTPNTLAGVISYQSGQSISAKTFERRIKEGSESLKNLSMTLPQWDVFCQIVGVPFDQLPR